MADPLRAALRVVRERLGDDGVRELVMAAVAAALDDVLSPVRTPARRQSRASPTVPPSRC